MKNLKTLCEYLILLCIGGAVYYCIELLWRGYSHWSMFLVGGVCFILIGLINRVYEYDMSLIAQTVIAGIIITFIELLAGLLFNIAMGLNVWDYSDISYNFLGQICLPFVYLWQWLSIVGIVLNDYTRYLLFKEMRPKYKLF